MNDWIGLAVFAAIGAIAWLGLRSLANPKPRSAEDFDRSVENSTSMLNASMNALQEMLNPEAAKSKTVQTELKVGRYNKKKREGKSGENDSAGTAELGD